MGYLSLHRHESIRCRTQKSWIKWWSLWCSTICWRLQWVILSLISTSSRLITSIQSADPDLLCSCCHRLHIRLDQHCHKMDRDTRSWCSHRCRITCIGRCSSTRRLGNSSHVQIFRSHRSSCRKCCQGSIRKRNSVRFLHLLSTCCAELIFPCVVVHRLTSYTSLAFGIIGFIACILSVDIEPKMTNKIEVFMDGEEEKARNNKSMTWF